jgi:DNA-binding CsgD family transcriptional regulator
MQSLENLIHKKKEELSSFTPSYSPIAQYKKSSFKTWKEYSDNCPPDTFMVMHNLLTREVIHSHKVDQMGYEANHLLDTIHSTHENDTSFLSYNITSLLLTIFKYHNGDRQLMNICLTRLRSLRNNKNLFQYLKITSLPISHDSQNNPIVYITWFTLIEPYNGQPYQVKMVPIKPSIESEVIVTTYNNLIKESFHHLSFTKRQKQIIQMINNGHKKKAISEQLQIAIRTVEKYNEQILNKGKLIFRLNSFRSSQDVVSHLSRMNILEEKESISSLI